MYTCLHMFAVQAFPSEYLLIDVEQQRIVRLNTSYIGYAHDSLKNASIWDHDALFETLPKQLNEVPYNNSSDDSDQLDTLPSSPIGSRLSPERRRYLEDLRQIEEECEAELDAVNASSFVWCLM